MKLFKNDVEGYFVNRPNRFIVEFKKDVNEETIYRSHCPNPGRILEITIPGTKLIFQESENSARKTPFSLVGAYYKDEIIPLYSGKANELAAELVIPKLFPRMSEIKGEVTRGHSRFDFLVKQDGVDHYIEVKACTLIEERVAMFPDAPTTRGTRHVRELCELGPGEKGHVLFIIMQKNVDIFIPHLHTDPDFALTISESREKIGVHAAAVTCDESGNAELITHKVPVELDYGRLAQADAGVYFLTMELEEDREIPFGVSKTGFFKKGFYVYAGSAKKNLSKRIARHKRLRKKKRWHIDYFREQAAECKAYPIYTKKDLECELAGEILNLADENVEGFGAGDCKCGSHLFYFREKPEKNRDFLDMLFHFRHVVFRE